MRLLLDSHALLWALFEPRRISTAVAAILDDESAQVFVSPISVFELELKKAKGALPFPEVTDWEAMLAEGGYILVPVTPAVAQSAVRLPRLHKDPWDRFLIAQAMRDGAALATTDAKVAAYGVPTLW